MHADVSVAEEDKPEQEVAKLDVAATAPIKHEHHMEATAQQPPPSAAPHSLPIKQEQPTGAAEQQNTHRALANASMTDADTHMADAGAHVTEAGPHQTIAGAHVSGADASMADVSVRMTDAGAEMDPLQHGHPAELQTPFDPHSDPQVALPAALYGNPPAGVLPAPQHNHWPQSAEQQAEEAGFDPNSFLTEPTIEPASGQRSVEAHDRRQATAHFTGNMQEPSHKTVPVKAEPGLLNGLTEIGSNGRHAAMPPAGSGPTVKAEPSGLHFATSSNGMAPAQQQLKTEPMDLDISAEGTVSGLQPGQTHSLGECTCCIPGMITRLELYAHLVTA